MHPRVQRIRSESEPIDQKCTLHPSECKGVKENTSIAPRQALEADAPSSPLKASGRWKMRTEPASLAATLSSVTVSANSDLQNWKPANLLLLFRARHPIPTYQMYLRVGLETKVRVFTMCVPYSLSIEYMNVFCSADAKMEGNGVVTDAARERIYMKSW